MIKLSEPEPETIDVSVDALWLLGELVGGQSSTLSQHLERVEQRLNGGKPLSEPARRVLTTQWRRKRLTLELTLLHEMIRRDTLALVARVSELESEWMAGDYDEIGFSDVLATFESSVPNATDMWHTVWQTIFGGGESDE